MVSEPTGILSNPFKIIIYIKPQGKVKFDLIVQWKNLNRSYHIKDFIFKTPFLDAWTWLRDNKKIIDWKIISNYLTEMWRSFKNNPK